MQAITDAHEVDTRRIAPLRFGVYASLVALLTGVGLFFVGGVRGAEPWVWFALASLGGVIGAVWWIRSVLGSGAVGAWPDGQEPDVEELEALDGSVYEDVAPGQSVQSSDDDVDYLMALRHEFRTPLNAVLGFSDVLLSGIDGEVNDSQREDLEIIRASGIRLRILLDSALDLSQIVDGELRLDADRTDVRDLVARVAVEAGQLWSNKRTAGCTLPDGPCIAAVDEARLRRSILVLADFLATDHRDANIGLSVVLSDGHVAIEVTADPSDRLTIDALPTPAEILASEDANEIRRWPVAVTSEVIARHDGSLYHGHAPSRFLIRLPLQSPR
ncbi:MAG: HAMP domain-containing histidine kinase [Deltaproteobacteria bacterium]|nr:HAMP domain-containing histidine kinase [Deltaproteobacteria bacterium]MBW2210305.1 HAMP domain-containing histidine kinase [Deltaproteobacteria bacterium]